MTAGVLHYHHVILFIRANSESEWVEHAQLCRAAGVGGCDRGDGVVDVAVA